MTLVGIELTATVILAVGFLLILMSLVKIHFTKSGEYAEFNLLDIITCQKGKVSRPACLEVGTWLLMAWGFVVLINREQWGLVLAYAGMMTTIFVLRAGHSAYLSSKNNGVEIK